MKEEDCSPRTDAERGRGRVLARGQRRIAYVSIAAVVGLGLAACGEGDIKEKDAEWPATAATSTWRSTRGSATRRARTSSVTSPRSSSAARSTYKDLKEDVSWQGFGTGEVDVVIEDWGHPDLEKKFFEGG